MDRKAASANSFERCPECEYRLPNHSYKCSIKTNVGRRDFLKKVSAIGAFAGIGGAGFLLGQANASPSNTNSILEPGSMAQDYDYIMFTDGTNWFARNNITGALDVKNSDFQTALVATQALGGKSFFVKPPNPWATIPLSAAIPLQAGMTLRGNIPKLTNVDPIPPEDITFAGGTVFSGSGIDAFTGNLIRSALVEDIGLSGFNNGFKHGAANTLGIASSCLRRIFFSNVLVPISITNFLFLRLDQIYAWLPTTNFILAQNDNTNWNGGNSLWTDLFAHGCKNVNGAVSLIAKTGYLNMIECHRLQVNMQDGAFGGSTTGYGLYLQGQSGTALCQNNSFYDIDIEGSPLDIVRLEDWSLFNYMHIAYAIKQTSGFHFSLKKNATTNAPGQNMLIFNSNVAGGNCKVECDNFNNFLWTALPLAPVTGGYPAGITGIGTASFGGVNFATMFGGGAGQTFIGGTTSNQLNNQTVPASYGNFQVPTGQDVEVGADIAITAYTSGTIQIQVSFTDVYNIARTIILPLNNNGTLATGASAAGYYSTPTITLSTKANTNISLATIGTFTATYSGRAFWRAAG